MSFHSYQSCSACSGGPKQGTVAIMRALIIKYTYIRSLGIYACRDIRGASSLSIHSCGRAGDPAIPTLSNGRANTSLGHPVIRDLSANAGPLGLMGLIYDRVRYDARSPRGRYYGGTHPHYDHIHFEQRDHEARTLTDSDVLSILGISTPAGGIMLGLDIGKTDDPITESELAGSLQVFLVEQGFDLGSFGPNNDGVDMRPGNVTRKALHDWKVQNGITSATSGGEGRIGMYEYGIMLAQEGGSGGHPDSDHSTLATKQAVDSLVVAERRKIDAHIKAKTNGPHN